MLFRRGASHTPFFAVGVRLTLAESGGGRGAGGMGPAGGEEEPRTAIVQLLRKKIIHWCEVDRN